MGMAKHSVVTKDWTDEQWLAFRNKGLGSTDVPVVVGLNKWRTPYQLWEQKAGMVEVKPFAMNDAMKWGLILEDPIAREYRDATGRKAQRDNKIHFHPEHPFLMCNLDWVTWNENAERGILEIKTTVQAAMAAWETEIPLMYYSQVQHQMYVTGMRWGEFALFILDRRQLRRIPFKYDKKFAEEQAKEAIAFWTDNVLTKVPPEMIAKDWEARNAEPGKVKEATSEIAMAVSAAYEAQAELKETETDLSEKTDTIKAYMGDAEILTVEGRTVITWKQGKDTSRFDSKTFRQDHPKLWQKYQLEKPGARTFRFKKELQQ
jgi:putative phage-type endonuclease